MMLVGGAPGMAMVVGGCYRMSLRMFGCEVILGEALLGNGGGGGRCLDMR